MDEVLCFMNVRNEELRLPFLLEYYRKLGVFHFFIVDNCSTDNTQQFLLEQIDVSVFETSESFRENRCGLNWLEALRNRYGNDRWCLTIDADEIFVYPFVENMNLRQLTEYMDSVGAEAMLALMIDCYPEGPLREARYSSGAPFAPYSPYFDSGPYYLGRNSKTGLVGAYGGPRYRAFYDNGAKGRGPVLRKVPIVKWVRGACYTSVNHAAGRLIFGESTGAILHYTFLNNFHEMVSRFVAHGDREPNDFYSTAQSVLSNDPDLSLFNESSVKYTDSLQLYDLNLLHCEGDIANFAAKQLRRAGSPDAATALYKSYAKIKRKHSQNANIPIEHLVDNWGRLSNDWRP